jgi:branched-chain amino acid transport system ATP-binding protein
VCGSYTLGCEKMTDQESMVNAALAIDSLCAGYGGRRIVRDVTLSLAAGERVLLVGPNGCGKSTLLRAVAGQAETLSGGMYLNGTNLERMTTDRRIALGLGYLRQQRNVFPSLTVSENLGLSHLRGGSSEATEFALATFPFLKGKFKMRAGALSGGERQALAISMVIRDRATVYLLDEPCAGLSPRSAGDIIAGIRNLHDRLGFACIVVEHNLRPLCPWVDRALIMSAGEVNAEVSDPGDLLDRAVLERHYFSETR